MFRSKRLNFAVILFGVLIVVIAAYAFIASQDIRTGPLVRITSPENGSSLTTQLVTIEGLVENTSSATLNGRNIFFDESGRYRERLLLAPGYNRFTIEAKDRFGTTHTQLLELVYDQQLTSN